MTQDHIMLTIVSAVTAFASVQIIKPWIKGFFTDVAKRRSVVRLVSVLLGAAIGYSLSSDILDMWLGASAGTLNATIVGVVKKRIKAKG